MKIFLLILILFGSIAGASQYLKQNPVNRNNQNARNSISPSVAQCNKTPLPENIEGPYYKEGSPQRITIRDEGTQGTPLNLTGTVMDSNCNPIANAWVDFWQTDGNGNYDNDGYRLRGHQFTDKNGKYILNTVVPGKYEARTPHMHVKLKATENSPVITTQLYVPGEERNNTDEFFTSATLIGINATNGEVSATYDFVLKTD